MAGRPTQSPGKGFIVHVDGDGEIEAAGVASGDGEVEASPDGEAEALALEVGAPPGVRATAPQPTTTRANATPARSRPMNAMPP